LPISWTSPPTSSTRASALPGTTSVTTTGSPIPRASAVAMFPAPMKPSFMPERLRLVEETLLDQPRALLCRDLDVARCQEENLVGDSLHPALERVGQARREVDQTLRQLGVGALQVDDDRDRVLELVGDLLRVVEALRDHEVDRDVARPAAVALDRAQRARAAARRRVVGEDVVELVTAALALQAAHVRAVAVAVLELLLGLGQVPLL